MNIGWIGTGLMGRPMAQRLLNAGHDVVVHNRTRASAEPLLQRGAAWAETPADAAHAREFVITMLPFPADVEDICLGSGQIVATAQPGAILVDMSTSSPALARRIAAAGERRGVHVLDAPVSGGPPKAEAGDLSIMVGGDAEALDRIRPLLDQLGGTVVHHGPSGAGQSAKLVNQVLIAGVMAGIAEAFTLARALNLDLDHVHQSVGGGAAASFLLEFGWPRLISGDLTPGFKISHFHKDLALAIESAERQGASLPTTSVVAELYERLVDSGHGDEGTQALIRAIDQSHPTEST
jgi:3-hydroxyisobutyrate dehydrogenase